MSNVIKQLTPNPVTNEHGENGCCQNPRAWEMEMMHQVWAAGLHDAANCFQDALEAKWKLESQRKVKPKTNGDRIRAMADEELAERISRIVPHCVYCPIRCGIFCTEEECKAKWLSWLRSPVEESHE